MNITLGIVKNIDFQFWLNSNEYYSSDILSTNVNTGINHAKKAGLIEKLVKNISSNGELVNLIDQRINYARLITSKRSQAATADVNHLR